MFNLIRSGGKKTATIKAWTKFVPPIENEALQQLENIAGLPFVRHHVAVMPDVHYGKEATIGSVIATRNAIIPAAVGVDIGCGMCALKTSLTANDLPDSLRELRHAIEKAVPHGRAGFDRGEEPKRNAKVWNDNLEEGFKWITERHPKLEKANSYYHLGTLGTGNHFIEMCLDTENNVWIMLHSGSRGIGNRIGEHFIQMAKDDMRRNHSISDLPDTDLAYLSEGTQHFDDYWYAVGWAQKFASINRQLMMEQVIEALHETKLLPRFETNALAVNCHHNYVQLENHFGEEVFLTRKGAVSARKGELGIIPGSMGARSYIVRGLGNPESFHSCSHGAGRVMSRRSAKEKYTLADHIAQTHGVECRKDEGVLDEIPAAYKDIDQVMKSQSDLVEIVYTLKQVLCVKG